MNRLYDLLSFVEFASTAERSVSPLRCAQPVVLIRKEQIMDNRKVLAGLVLGSALLVACEQRPEAAPSSRNNPPAKNTNGNIRNGVSSTGVDPNVEVRAQTLIDQVNRHIRDMEYDAAETNLSELESMKSTLPARMQTQIATLRTTPDIPATSRLSGVAPESGERREESAARARRIHTGAVRPRFSDPLRETNGIESEPDTAFAVAQNGHDAGLNGPFAGPQTASRLVAVTEGDAPRTVSTQMRPRRSSARQRKAPRGQSNAAPGATRCRRASSSALYPFVWPPRSGRRSRRATRPVVLGEARLRLVRCVRRANALRWLLSQPTPPRPERQQV